MLEVLNKIKENKVWLKNCKLILVLKNNQKNFKKIKN